MCLLSVLFDKLNTPPKINQANIERSLLLQTEIFHILRNNRRNMLFIEFRNQNSELRMNKGIFL